MENPLTEKEVNHIFEALEAFREEFCNVRAGRCLDVNDEDVFICNDCPFNDHGDCKLKIWVHKHGRYIR